jgi:UDP-N-acetylmuramoyl-tripeptide--D-alanyl-D-alanine ligase
MSIQQLYEVFQLSPSISTDSRKIRKGDIFWAIKGTHFDGNQFVDQALESGADYIVTENPYYKTYPNTIYVEDSLQALADLALFHRRKLGIPIIVITGTNGKTTTKELTSAVLSQKYKVGFTQGNLNNHIGVPLTILSFNKHTEIGVVEAGANHPGEIEYLCRVAEPDFGLITNIGKAHLEGFGSFEVLVRTKAELYESIGDRGRVFLNSENMLLRDLARNRQIISYGGRENDFCRGEFIAAEPFVSFNILGQEKTRIDSNLIGKYNFENLMAASCIGKYFGVEELEIKLAIEEYIPQNNRSQVVKKGSTTIILDAYNANPSSMHAAIETFKEMKGRKKVILLGDMFELGEYEEDEHKKLIEKLIQIKNNEPETIIFLAGHAFENAHSSFGNKTGIRVFTTTELLIDYIKTIQFTDSMILVKGSRGMKMETVLNHMNL